MDLRLPHAPDDPPQLHLLSAISNEMVRLYKEQFGRGPTKVRTNWAGEDTVIVTLENTLTPAERRLRQLGENQRLRDLRMLFQYAEQGAFCEPVERLTGRRVRAFVSGIDTVADVATEIFVLHPRGYDGPSAADTPPALNEGPTDAGQTPTDPSPVSNVGSAEPV